MGEFPNLGTRLHGGIDPRRCVELAKVAEANGFTSVWFAENPFNRGVLPAASASAAATHSMRIGIGVFNPYNRHPTLIAMEIGALADLGQEIPPPGRQTPRALGALQKSEIEKWWPIIKAAKIKAE